MSLTVHVNTGAVDNTLQTSGTTFTEWSESNDSLIFTAGSSEVQDAADTPTQQELNSAGIILTGSQIIVSEYLMLDAGSNVLRDIFLMGNLDSRYVVACDFDASTASEPTLHAYDDDTLSTATGTFLGSGTPSNSFLRGAVTTSGSAGSNWAPSGTKLAGDSSGNYLELNDGSGALSGATTLYFILAVVIPASITTGFSSTPILAVKYLST